MKDHRDKSFWLANYGAYIPNPALAGNIKVDVAIIGGGFTGLTDVWFVNRGLLPWPPEPFHMVASQAILGYLHLEDKLFEREIARED